MSEKRGFTFSLRENEQDYPNASILQAVISQYVITNVKIRAKGVLRGLSYLFNFIHLSIYLLESKLQWTDICINGKLLPHLL